MRVAGEIAEQRENEVRRLNLLEASYYTKARKKHELLRKVREISDGPHGFEPDNDERYDGKTNAKKPCLICGAGKRAKIHDHG